MLSFVVWLPILIVNGIIAHVDLRRPGCPSSRCACRCLWLTITSRLLSTVTFSSCADVLGAVPIDRDRRSALNFEVIVALDDPVEVLLGVGSRCLLPLLVLEPELIEVGTAPLSVLLRDLMPLCVLLSGGL